MAPYWGGLGDLWAVVSHSCLLSRKENDLVHLSKWSTMSMRNREQDIRAILNSFEEEFAQNVVVADEAMRTVPEFGVRQHHSPYVPTKVKWTRSDSKIISYQIDSGAKHRPERFCDPLLIDRLKGLRPDYSFVALGKEHQATIAEIIEILSQSECFIGIDSGISHVAHSVGVPVFLKDYPELALAHPNKEYIAFGGEKDLIVKLGALLG